MASSGGGNGSDSLGSNPASALVASSRPPIPLAPRLTTASTSQQVHHTRSTSAQGPAEGSQAVRLPRLPRPLIHRASLSTATQALNVDTSPPSARFSAYNTPRPPRNRLQGSLSRPTQDHIGIPSRKSVGSFAFGLDDSTATQIRQRRAASAETDAAEDHFEVLSQFRTDADFPGNVLVRCTGADFYVHRAVLYFASPFFQAVLDGDWKETHPSLHALSDSEDEDTGSTSAEEDIAANVSNTSLVMDDGQELSAFGSATSPRASFHTADFAFEGLDKSLKVDSLSLDDGELQSSAYEATNCDSRPVTAMQQSEKKESTGGKQDTTGRLKRLATPPPDEDFADSSSDSPTKEVNKASLRRRGRSAHKSKRDIVAVIDLSEEDANTFQDFLRLVYPNLDLLVTWYNIFPLFSFSDKFEVPHLRRACVTFLRAALAGRPIEAMALSERHGIEDVYREASRHVLENLPSWEPEELEILSSETLLKLERKRTWFLERLLKLGLANPARDYECHSSCPDPTNCARLLHERWRSQYANAFKFGPPQPSIIWRHLRELEASAASLITAPAMSACQSSSKAWVQLLFDRMYGLPTHGMTHPKFLSIKLDSDHAPILKVKRKPTDGGVGGVGDMTLPS